MKSPISQLFQESILLTVASEAKMGLCASLPEQLLASALLSASAMALGQSRVCNWELKSGLRKIFNKRYFDSNNTLNILCCFYLVISPLATPFSK